MLLRKLQRLDQRNIAVDFQPIFIISNVESFVGDMENFLLRAKIAQKLSIVDLLPENGLELVDKTSGPFAEPVLNGFIGFCITAGKTSRTLRLLCLLDKLLRLQ